MPDVNWNLPTKTLGGLQFWGDVAHRHGWRIQQNVFTRHYRLLDANDVRRAWGDKEACLAALRESHRDLNLPAMRGKVVILLHGITRSSKSFSRMGTVLRAAGYTPIGFDYPSTRVPIPESAGFLRQVIESLDGVEEINFVVHSMGGLVVRSCVGMHCDPRIRRMVMLGVPNLGARMANVVRELSLFKLIFGPAGQQLIEDAAGLIPTLPTPPFEFAVVAGARGTPDGFNPLIPGDDDGTVSVAATRLPGAADFMTVNKLHSFLMADAEVIEATLRFLQTGALREGGAREPIP
jgi:pimeloyl-ACP methyl ester carboxylesterase